MDKWALVILGAGKSTRFKSGLPKLLHPIAGKPMIQYVLEAVKQAGPYRVCMVIGHEAERIKAALGDSINYVSQAQQKGSGHALRE